MNYPTTAVTLAALALVAPASAQLKFAPGEDARFHWDNFEELKKVEILEERDQVRGRGAEAAREQAELDRIGAQRPTKAAQGSAA